MDPIELQYDTMDAVPEAFRGLFSERDGKAVLTHVNGLKSQADVDTVKEALRKEREGHQATTLLLKPWSGLKHDEVTLKLGRYDELEAASKGKIDESAIETIVGNRLKLKTGPLEAQLAERDTVIKTLTDENVGLKTEKANTKLREVVRNSATKSKVHSTAVSDVELVARDMMQFDESGKLVTKEGLEGIPAGLDMDGFLKVMFKLRPHWWPESEGGGSKGGNGGGFNNKNPWSKEHWNMTEQGNYLKENGADAAGRLAKAAGSYVGATGPKA